MILRKVTQSLFAVLLLLIPAIATAQTPAAASGDQLLKPEQLEALVSPIALYPDSLLSNVLMASTYPLEVVQADRWLSQNKNLSGDMLKAAVDKESWDDSVKALIATPPVLTMMSSKLDWLQKLGDAVLAQQPDVAAAIQRLRLKAQDNGKLTTTPQQKVTVEQQDNQKTVVIEQASDDTVYAPAYDPGVMYGDWPYAEYPPYYWGYPGIAAGVLTRGLWFGAGYAVGRWASGAWGWGGRVNWSNGNIVRNWPRATPYNVTNINNIGNRSGNTWQHNPTHRQGVRYNNAGVQQRFGNNNLRAGAGQRTDFRGHAAAAAGGAAAGAAIRGATQRPSAATRPTQQRQAAGNKAANRAGTGGAKRDTAMNVQPRKTANAQSARGHASAGARGPQFAARSAGGGGPRASVGGGGGMRGGGGGRGGGGRRSDIALKHDVVLLGHLDNGLGFYRFSYNGSDKAYVGVIAQEVQAMLPQAVVRGHDGYLRVFYDRLGVPFETYERWLAAGAHVPAGPRVH
jgi:hypothetical protein